MPRAPFRPTTALTLPSRRALASPMGVIITLPLLVMAVGLGIMLVGRDAEVTDAIAEFLAATAAG